eukprot:TRINITY_DN23321_c0_g1_i1.p1 TRINITY_DN23321_c0_g1~~TRINITY_DN23321_c0_g1_i1.p1  ORF type:complete len:550 (-),score=63.41 TRINITY_DN23321_c0_g1_i1:260-1909(-)
MVSSSTSSNLWALGFLAWIHFCTTERDSENLGYFHSAIRVFRHRNEGDRLPLIPYPASVEYKDGPSAEPFDLSDDVRVVIGNGISDSDLAVQSLRRQVSNAASSQKTDANATPAQSERKISMKLHRASADESDEAYQLKVDKGSVELQAPSSAGLFYGVQTLRQLAQKGDDGRMSLPAVTIRDSPRMAWRGLHLDVSRHFFNASQVKRLLDTMAAFKLNTFHWHLTDDQGWRLPVKKYPALTQIGAKSVTDATEAYSEAEIQDVIRYAQERHIQVIPEVDVPGHASAAIAAYPALGNDDIPGWTSPKRPMKRFGAMDNTLSPSAGTMSFLQEVFSKVSELFPSPYVHIGGDEASTKQWMRSRKARSTGLIQVQSYFNRNVAQMLQQKNRAPIVWDEAQHMDGLPKNAVVMAWRSTDEMTKALEDGRRVVNTNLNKYYFDHYQSRSSREPYAICCYTSLRDVYEYDPVPNEVKDDPSKSKLFLGAQAQLWSEYFPSWTHVEYMAHPRSIALAERAWTSQENVQSFGEFRSRLEKRLPDLDEMGVNYRHLD